MTLALCVPGVALAQEGATTRRISVSFDGEPADSRSYTCDISRDNRVVAFDSFATNLVEGDTNDWHDAFVWEGGQVTRVSVASNGREAGGMSDFPKLSADGRLVAFRSMTWDLRAPSGRNRQWTTFVHDRSTGKTTRVSVQSDGGRPNADVGVHAISDSGRYVTFGTTASNLAAKGDHNGYEDVFVHDRRTGKTNRVSLSRTGGDPNSDSGSPDISGNGRFVVYSSYASNLVRRDRNQVPDIFVYDREERRTEVVSVAADGRRSRDYSSWPAISGDGRFVSFSSSATLASSDTAGGEDVYVHDRHTGRTEHVSVDSEERPLNEESGWSSISEDGRYVAFATFADNPGTDDTNEAMDVYVRDRELGTTTRVSLGDEGQEPNGGTWPPPSISPDGRWVCWATVATNLDDKESSGKYEDIYLRGPLWEE